MCFAFYVSFMLIYTLHVNNLHLLDTYFWHFFKQVITLWISTFWIAPADNLFWTITFIYTRRLVWSSLQAVILVIYSSTSVSRGLRIPLCLEVILILNGNRGKSEIKLKNYKWTGWRITFSHKLLILPPTSQLGCLIVFYYLLRNAPMGTVCCQSMK